MPLSYNLQVLKKWAEQSGLKFSPLPLSRNIDKPFGGRGACGLYDTCGDVCPTGARYSPDYTYQQLIASKKVTLHDRMLVRKLVLTEGRDTIAAAQGYHQDRPNEITEYRARMFVLASGQCWSPHLLLLSANSRFPNGLANRSGLVGRYMNGHKFISAQAAIDEQTFPGQNMTHSLISREHFRCATNQPVRPPRHARVGKLRRQGTAVARRRRTAVARRRASRRVAIARPQGQLGAPARLLRLASVGRQPADARSRVEEPLRRSDAEDRSAARCGGHRA